MHNIGLLEAVRLWLGGAKLDGMAIQGISVVWWSRMAKTASFVSGLTVLLDIIGPQRIIELGRSLETKGPSTRARAAATYIGAAALMVSINVGLIAVWYDAPEVVVLALLMAAALLSVLGTGARAVQRFGAGLEHPLFQKSVRIASLSVFAVAFVVDELTS